MEQIVAGEPRQEATTRPQSEGAQRPVDLSEDHVGQAASDSAAKAR